MVTESASSVGVGEGVSAFSGGCGVMRAVADRTYSCGVWW
jgi:hypothetical protein